MTRRSSTDSRPEAIGIYEPRRVGGRIVFVRPDPGRLGDDWPPRTELEPKVSASARRICFIGESTAAGFYYAPHLTPAAVLEHVLNAVKGAGTYEVIDLTKIDLAADGVRFDLVTLTVAALQLEPDMLVIFAGNNWSALVKPRAASGPAHFQWFAPAYREAGPRGLKDLCARHEHRQYDRVLENLGHIARTAQIPVVVVLPEANLGDWERGRPVSWLRAGRTARWHELHQRAVPLLNAHRWTRLRSHAEQMIELDEETSPVSLRLLGAACLAQGNIRAARRCFEQEIDADRWLTGSVPGPSTVVRRLMTRAPARHGLRSVSLPDVFAEYATGIPGRSLFLDYCHLSREGIGVAMAAVATEVLRIDGSAHRWQDLVRAGTQPPLSRERDAVAMFLGAMCTLHWERRLDRESPLPAYWLTRALETWRGIRSLMADTLAMHAAPVEAWGLSAAEQQLFGTARMLHDSSHLLRGEGRRLKRMTLDARAVRLFGGLLEADDAGAVRHSRDLLRMHHAIERRPRELVQPYYHWDHLDALTSCLDDPTCSGPPVYQAPWRTSSFCFVAGARRDAVVAITARVPESERRAGARVGILVNGARLGTVGVGRTWRRSVVAVPRTLLTSGVNQLTFRWPAVSRRGTQSQGRIRRRLEDELPVNLHPVFGELASVRVGVRSA